VESQGAIISNSLHLVPFNFMVNHHLDDLFPTIYDLDESHVHVDASKHFGFEINLLDVLEVGHNAFVVDRKRYIFYINQNLVNRGI
jgi:hypothetical protein